MVPLQPGPNELVITAIKNGGVSVSATVHVEFSPVALSRTGCSSAAPADLLGLLAVALLARRRRR